MAPGPSQIWRYFECLYCCFDDLFTSLQEMCHVILCGLASSLWGAHHVPGWLVLSLSHTTPSAQSIFEPLPMYQDLSVSKITSNIMVDMIDKSLIPGIKSHLSKKMQQRQCKTCLGGIVAACCSLYVGGFQFPHQMFIGQKSKLYPDGAWSCCIKPPVDSKLWSTSALLYAPNPKYPV